MDHAITVCPLIKVEVTFKMYKLIVLLCLVALAAGKSLNKYSYENIFLRVSN